MSYPVINGGTIDVDSFISDSSLISTDGSGNLNIQSLLLSNTSILSFDTTNKVINFNTGSIGTKSGISLPTSDPNNIGQWWNKDGYIVISGSTSSNALDDVLIYNSTTTDLYFKTSNFILSKNLPTSDPNVNGQLWNNGGIICISNGEGTIPTNRISIINSINYDSTLNLLDFSKFDIVYIDSTLPTSDPNINGQLWNNGGILSISVSSTLNSVTKVGSSSPSITTDEDTFSSLIITGSEIFFDSLSTTIIESSGRLWNNGGTVAISIIGTIRRIKTKMPIENNSQSTFNFPYDYSQNIDIFLNGLLIDESEYTITGDTFTFSSDISDSLTTSDILYFILYL